MMETKQCLRCSKTKPVSEFYRAAQSKDGYRGRCKQCTAEAAGRVYRAKENLPEGKKRCTVCGRVLPATSEWFKVDKRRKCGVGAICRRCASDATQRYYREHADERRVYNLQRHYANREQELARMRARYQANKAEHRRKTKLWYQKNRERMREVGREYYLAKREIVISRVRLWRKNNYERYREYNQLWMEENPEKVAAMQKARDVRYRGRKRNLPSTFTAEGWAKCLEYWGYQCAVCGVRENLHADHWVALAHPDSPGTVAENMLCLCSHCNLTKSARDAVAWLTDKLGAEAAAHKLQVIKGYFDWVRTAGQKDGE